MDFYFFLKEKNCKPTASSHSISSHLQVGFGMVVRTQRAEEISQRAAFTRSNLPDAGNFPCCTNIRHTNRITAQQPVTKTTTPKHKLIPVFSYNHLEKH